MGIYGIGVLGSVTDQQRLTLQATLRGMLDDFGLVIGTDVVVYDGASVNGRERRAAFAAAYFGGVPHTDLPAVRDLISTNSPIIPILDPPQDFTTNIPEILHASNGLRCRPDDPELEELACALLECVGLLRRQRRVFISYRRIESRAAAMQLHDLTAARGFDVFLDTHDIRPGDPFQDVLWHRLCDSDVVVMLDTPAYFDSRWTRQEIGRARAKDIQVLRVVWPGHTPSRLTDMAETIHLDADALSGPSGPIRDEVADKIVLAVEHLRSRSIASRYLSITGRLRADVEKIGAKIEGIGAHRAICVRLPDDQRIWAYPVVGIPTAEVFYDIADKARRAEQLGAPVIVYDHIGIRESWNAHLKWLDENIATVKAIKVSEAGWTLAAWES
ncbi:molecular chaperone Tir [Rhodoplanes elegans]|uniref:Molecular chaperone Tir n=1 Tax=Rhodoplanes elegans TaxID=29408 RepID=A0A327L2L5_9BRAD|nr:toll/interleukin-1 receptor domain-containing protein [Rhodoplanes elegans]MBK5961287.1 molecular chaperone Tir [Rhodoplanes elegans]RAI41938.1 molecular chaperone Tir [Rhodoplanes elegans]